MSRKSTIVALALAAALAFAAPASASGGGGGGGGGGACAPLTMDVSVGHSHGHYFLTIPTSVHNCARTREPFVLSVFVVGFEDGAWGIDTMGAPLQPGQTFTRAALPRYTLALGGTYTVVGTVTIGGATTTLTQTVTVPDVVIGA